MPLQNRVSPDGDLVATPARGTMFGNRGGRIHTDGKGLTNSRWKSKAWICCVLCFKDRQRDVMGAGYTEMFFLDEATALAAGHRPCFECRREDAMRFSTLWNRARTRPGRAYVADMDQVLHKERLSILSNAKLNLISCYTIFQIGPEYFIKLPRSTAKWSFEGYTESAIDPDSEVRPITPLSIQEIFRLGYVPKLHPSADAF